MPGQQHVPGDDRLLGRRPASRPARAGPATTPSFICAPTVSRGSSACWAITPSNALTYSSARRMSTRVGHAVPVVGEDPHPGRRVGHRAELGQPLAGQPDGDRADRAARRPARPRGRAARPARPRRRCPPPARCWPSRTPPCSRRARPPGSRSRPSRRPPGRARAGACAGRPARAARPARPRRDLRRPRGACPASAIDPVPDQQVDRLARRTARTPLISVTLVCVHSPGRRRRAAGRARPSARSPRWRPARRSSSGAVVGDLGGDLHAAVHRARVHDDRVRRAAAPSGRASSPYRRLYSRADGKNALRHPLPLHPQHHHHVAPWAGASRS